MSRPEERPSGQPDREIARVCSSGESLKIRRGASGAGGALGGCGREPGGWGMWMSIYQLFRLSAHFVPGSPVGASPVAASPVGARQCAGINRHMVGDERALQERNSETILASSFALAIVR